MPGTLRSVVRCLLGASHLPLLPSAMFGPPLPWHLERTRPQPAMRVAGLSFLIDVVPRVPLERHRPSATHHGSSEIRHACTSRRITYDAVGQRQGACATHGDGTSVAVRVARHAVHLSSTDQVP